jgi:hypothetical protein
MLSDSAVHQDLGADYFERRSKDHLRRHHVDRLKQLGYEVVIKKEAA